MLCCIITSFGLVQICTLSEKEEFAPHTDICQGSKGFRSTPPRGTRLVLPSPRDHCSVLCASCFLPHLPAVPPRCYTLPHSPYLCFMLFSSTNTWGSSAYPVTVSILEVSCTSAASFAWLRELFLFATASPAVLRPLPPYALSLRHALPDLCTCISLASSLGFAKSRNWCVL